MLNKFSLLHFFLGSFLVCPAASAETIRSEGLSLLQELRLAGSDTERAQRLQIKDINGATVLDTDKVLPRIVNAYSPYSYDGYRADLLAERHGVTLVTDLQGERYTMILPASQAGDYLTLITSEEGNGAYNFNLKFKYDDVEKSFSLTQILLNENNTKCDQALLSTYAVGNKSLGFTSINDFDGTRTFAALRDLRLSRQTSGVKTVRLMPEEVSKNFDAALQAHKMGKDEELKTLVGYFMAGDGNGDGACDPESYIVEKYYFPQQVGWSNDLGFLFEQAGYYSEASELLKHITLKHPNRIVTYLNLADAYWAQNKLVEAREAYNYYYQRMSEAQKQYKIPRRVVLRK